MTFLKQRIQTLSVLKVRLDEAIYKFKSYDLTTPEEEREEQLRCILQLLKDISKTNEEISFYKSLKLVSLCEKDLLQPKQKQLELKNAQMEAKSQVQADSAGTKLAKRNVNQYLKQFQKALKELFVAQEAYTASKNELACINFDLNNLERDILRLDSAMQDAQIQLSTSEANFVQFGIMMEWNKDKTEQELIALKQLIQMAEDFDS